MRAIFDGEPNGRVLVSGPGQFGFGDAWRIQAGESDAPPRPYTVITIMTINLDSLSLSQVSYSIYDTYFTHI